jgi:hypothetical protein
VFEQVAADIYSSNVSIGCKIDKDVALPHKVDTRYADQLETQEAYGGVIHQKCQTGNSL